MKRYKYQSYDYSFLHQEKKSWFSTASRVFAKTIGFDLVETKPMNEPLGKIYWIDSTYSPSTDRIVGNYTTSTTGPSIPITISNYNDFITAFTTASNHIEKLSNNGTANYIVANSTVADILRK